MVPRRGAPARGSASGDYDQCRVGHGVAPGQRSSVTPTPEPDASGGPKSLEAIVGRARPSAPSRAARPPRPDTPSAHAHRLTQILARERRLADKRAASRPIV